MELSPEVLSVLLVNRILLKTFFVFNFPIENNKVLLLFAFYYSFTLPRYPLTKTRKSEYTTNLFYKVMGNTSDPNLIFFFFKVQRILSSFLLLKLYEMVNQPLESPSNPHFFQPLLPGFDTHLVCTTLSVFSSVYVPHLDSVLVHFAFLWFADNTCCLLLKIHRKKKQAENSETKIRRFRQNMGS